MLRDVIMKAKELLVYIGGKTFPFYSTQVGFTKTLSYIDIYVSKYWN